MGVPAELSEFFDFRGDSPDEPVDVNPEVKSGSQERAIDRSQRNTEEDKKDEERKRLSGAQTTELQNNFSRLFAVILEDLQDLDEEGQMANDDDQEELDQRAIFIETLLHHTLVLPKWEAEADTTAEMSPQAREAFERKKAEAETTAQEANAAAENLTVLTDEEKIAMGVQAYAHALDILPPFTAGDRDAYDEDVKDRERSNPLAKQLKEARRLRSAVRQYKTEFPEEARRDAKDAKKTQNDNIDEQPQYHPTNILPPPNPQLEGDLSVELE